MSTKKNLKFAVIKTGGKQYRVSEGDKLRIEKILVEEGKDVVFKEVLLCVDGDSVEIGTPNLAGIKVVARVLAQDKAKKVIVFKYKKRKRYSVKKGHRQPYTEIEIVDIKKGTGEKISTTQKSSTKPTTKPGATVKKTTK